MTPWVTILVGLGSGVLGTLISTMLRLSHEREAELRSRMLEAADDFVLAAQRVHTATERAVRLRHDEPDEDDLETVEDPDPANYLTPETIGAWDEANALVDALFERAARVELLFGDDSTAADEARMVVADLRSILSGLEGFPRDLEALAQGMLLEVFRHRHEFNAAARDELGRRTRRSFVGRWRRRRAHAAWRSNFEQYARNRVDWYLRAEAGEPEDER